MSFLSVLIIYDRKKNENKCMQFIEIVEVDFNYAYFSHVLFFSFSLGVLMQFLYMHILDDSMCM